MVNFNTIADQINGIAARVNPLEITREVFRSTFSQMQEAHASVTVTAEDYAAAKDSALERDVWVFAVKRPPQRNLVKPLAVYAQVVFDVDESTGQCLAIFWGFTHDIALAMNTMELFDLMLEREWQDIVTTRKFKDANKSRQTLMRREHQAAHTQAFAEILTDMAFDRERAAYSDDEATMVMQAKHARIAEKYTLVRMPPDAVKALPEAEYAALWDRSYPTEVEPAPRRKAG